MEERVGVFVEGRGREVRIRVAGAMTIYAARSLRADLVAAVSGPARVSLVLSDVSEIDSAGLQLLLFFEREVRGQGGELRLEAVSEAVREVLELSNTASVLGWAA